MSRVDRLFGVAVVLLFISACGGGGDGGSGGGTQPPTSFTVSTTTTGSGSGTISPTSGTVSQGSTTSFTISPADGSSIADVSGCGGSLNGSTYTTGPIAAACSVNVTFAALNPMPVVSAGLDQIAYSGELVSLDAEASDPDGTIVSYVWSQIDGPTVQLDGSNQSSASFTAPDVASETALRFQLTATDDQGASASDTVLVTVRPSGSGLAPTANAGPDHVVPVFVSNVRTVTLNGSSSSDPEGDQIYFSWTLVSRPDGSNSIIHESSSAFASIIPDLPGIYRIELVVTDGLTSSQPDSVVVIAGRWINGVFNSGLTLTAAEGPYYFGGVEVPHGAEVEIGPGVDIYKGYLSVDGTLRVLGTADDGVGLHGTAVISSNLTESPPFRWYFSHVVFDQQAYLEPNPNVGSIQMSDSVYWWDGKSGPIFLGTSDIDQYIERNIFVAKAVGLSTTSGLGRVYFRNNVIIHDAEVWAEQGIKIGATGYLTDVTRLELSRNSILVRDSYMGATDWWPCEADPYLIEIRQCPIVNASEQDFDLSNTYWGTTDPDVINSWILDGRDGTVEPWWGPVGIVYFDPVLPTPDAATPDPAPYLNYPTPYPQSGP